ncbi:MAG: hypothetical protein V4507_15680 [Verrucomicrobiota bacterium]
MKKCALLIAVLVGLYLTCQAGETSKNIGGLTKKTSGVEETFALFGLTSPDATPIATSESIKAFNEPCAEGEKLDYNFKSQYPVKLKITSNGETLAEITNSDFKGTVVIPKKGNSIPVYCRFEFSSIGSNHSQVHFAYR